MKIEGTVEVECVACGQTSEHRLVQLVHAQQHPELADKLRLGELNRAECECGKRTSLACELVYQDPEASLLVHVCPGGEPAMKRAEAVFEAAFTAPLAAEGAGAGYRVQRIVPSQNALLEKIAILRAGLEDWAIEMVKVLLLASIGEQDDDRVLLFAGVDSSAQTVRWLLFDHRGEEMSTLSSPLAAVQRLVATSRGAPPVGERRIDRAWAVAAVRAMVAAGN